MTLWDLLADFFNANGVTLLRLLITLAAGYILIKIGVGSLKKLLRKRHVDAIAVNFTASVSYILLITILMLAVFDILSISITPFITVLGTVGLALALSLKESLSNVASGVILLVTKPFRQGDYVSVGGIEGNVTQLKFFTTELLTFDNKKIFLPNNKVASTEIINYSAMKMRRLDLKYNLPYGTKPEEVRAVIFKIIGEHNVLTEPAPQIYLAELSQNYIQYSARLWVLTENYWTTYFSMQEKVYSALVNSFEVPYPKMEISVKEKIQPGGYT